MAVISGQGGRPAPPSDRGMAGAAVPRLAWAGRVREQALSLFADPAVLQKVVLLGSVSLLLLLLFPFLAFDIVRIRYSAPIDYNEGWNAIHAGRVFAGESLYTPLTRLTPVNYPPLSFVIIGAIGSLDWFTPADGQSGVSGVDAGCRCPDPRNGDQGWVKSSRRPVGRSRVGGHHGADGRGLRWHVRSSTVRACLLGGSPVPLFQMGRRPQPSTTRSACAAVLHLAFHKTPSDPGADRACDSTLVHQQEGLPDLRARRAAGVHIDGHRRLALRRQQPVLQFRRPGPHDLERKNEQGASEPVWLSTTLGSVGGFHRVSVSVHEETHGCRDLLPVVVRLWGLLVARRRRRRECMV